jgi:hypothetical protein
MLEFSAQSIHFSCNSEVMIVAIAVVALTLATLKMFWRRPPD